MADNPPPQVPHGYHDRTAGPRLDGRLTWSPAPDPGRPSAGKQVARGGVNTSRTVPRAAWPMSHSHHPFRKTPAGGQPQRGPHPSGRTCLPSWRWEAGSPGPCRWPCPDSVVAAFHVAPSCRWGPRPLSPSNAPWLSLPSSVSTTAFNRQPRVQLEKELATHSSVLAWRIPRPEEPGGTQSLGSREADTAE